MGRNNNCRLNFCSYTRIHDDNKKHLRSFLATTTSASLAMAKATIASYAWPPRRIRRALSTLVIFLIAGILVLPYFYQALPDVTMANNSDLEKTKADSSTAPSPTIKADPTSKPNATVKKKHNSSKNKTQTAHKSSNSTAYDRDPNIHNKTATNSDETFEREYNGLELKDMIAEDGKIIGDVSHLLDWAVLGFAKCGTSSLLQFLNTNSSKDLDHERCDASWHRGQGLPGLVESLYNDLPRTGVKRGLKCPSGLTTTSIQNYSRYFNRTNIIVGLRHPVLWFESFYNYRVQSGQHIMPPVNELIKGEALSVSVKKSRFHLNLVGLGKTPLDSDLEWKLLLENNDMSAFNFGYIRTPMKVFVYEIGQLADTNATRVSQFESDLGRFIGVDDLGGMVKANARSKNPPGKASMISICDEEYNQLRKALMKNSRDVSRWVRLFFLDSVDVIYSSRWYLDELLDAWEYDPCIDHSN